MAAVYSSMCHTFHVIDTPSKGFDQECKAPEVLVRSIPTQLRPNNAANIIPTSALPCCLRRLPWFNTRLCTSSRPLLILDGYTNIVRMG
ncbi:hypothetical protein HBI56_101910 [Parastagonospora nodorum]|uniref:Uncharacterized protein n=1 Tax=Phaeosphaeria nodorum (strain SN15 / ATCC MYA-4574 / FGSC 10173) TaxID=321614 RepID=Q0UNL9_PHANO|nr:hypothetical protein SNOG_06645 [Parastagonospora nodorum SN15]KAH3919267.1 hypothetical protein HBH56_030870 [Parastagonospora nodorum]EAT86476.1 hypothetical protein SNOG_06645 [Parastagonospora nodorum SN15]KAH3934572.1 hypothetical protein HBH54_051140 [Parastagonospora nodorum]KAH3956618.1 hypothetical protein HBH51_238490 [Parastagonospora nodorum]KAH3985327.1 hypothetical protein HBH52_049870 [Parastagonospora nodorum]